MDGTHGPDYGIVIDGNVLAGEHSVFQCVHGLEHLRQAGFPPQAVLLVVGVEMLHDVPSGGDVRHAECPLAHYSEQLLPLSAAVGPQGLHPMSPSGL